MHLSSYASLGQDALPSVTQHLESSFACGIEIVEHKFVRSGPLVPEQHSNRLLVRLLVDLYGEALPSIFPRQMYRKGPLAAWLWLSRLILESDVIDAKDIADR